MLNNFRNLQSLFWSHGSRWLLFRFGYALRKRTGFIRPQMPSIDGKIVRLRTWLKSNIPSTPEAYTQWRKQNSPKFFMEPLRAERSESVSYDGMQSKRAGSTNLPWNPQAAVDEAERILNGELKYFAQNIVKPDFLPIGTKIPVSGKRLDSKKHWSEISDDDDLDIKFIWEASRFSMVYPLVRAYAATRDEKFAEAFWTLIQILGGIQPSQHGTQLDGWAGGGLTSHGMDVWLRPVPDSPSSTPERIAQFTVLVAAHAERIYKNIDYAISTHSNHTISEAFGLWLVGLLFPELKDAEKYHQLGRRLLEQEAAAQIFPDGSYSCIR